MDKATIPKLHKRWHGDIEAIRKAVADTSYQRTQFHRIMEMTQRDRGLLARTPFLFDLRRWYTAWVAMAIRRQTDKDTRVVSLRRLLEDMRAAPGALSNIGFLGRQLTVKQIEQDLNHLYNVSRNVRRLANREIAHAQRGGAGSLNRPTFNEKSGAIDEIERLVKKYSAIFTGVAWVQLEPIDHGWWEQFKSPWHKRDDVERTR